MIELMTKHLNIYSAPKYVVSVRTKRDSRKIFQVISAKNDGSVYITFPYYRADGGQMGEVCLDANRTYPSDLIVGDDFSVSTHFVKYSHHPSGLAQFSLTGKVRSTVRRPAAPLGAVNGHFFTLMVKGLSHFEIRTEEEKQFSRKRGLVEFGLDCDLNQSLKFMGYYYSERELAARAVYGDKTPWIAAVTPDGRKIMSIGLATNYTHQGERTYLMLTGERVPSVTESQDVFLSFMGGFDPPEIAFDPGRATSFLMFIYPAEVQQSTLQNIDLSSVK
jgi:hypothetical protein